MELREGGANAEPTGRGEVTGSEAGAELLGRAGDLKIQGKPLPPWGRRCRGAEGPVEVVLKNWLSEEVGEGGSLETQ